jgi:hypothetical protein
MNSEIKGIPQGKLDRLMMHLRKVEEITGSKCIKSPRWEAGKCPICRFCPSTIMGKFYFQSGTPTGLHYYGGNGESKDIEIFSATDSAWWNSLSRPKQKEVTRYVIRQLRGVNKNG